VILLDTSGVLAGYDRAHFRHADVVEVLRGTGPRALSPFVLAELDYLVPRCGGQPAELSLLDDVARGAYRLEQMHAGDIETAAEVIKQYADLHLGLADASIVVLARRYGCRDLLTFDQRHFRAMLGPGGEPFRLLPDDL
jgi:predicted nucleic acid-binding protein